MSQGNHPDHPPVPGGYTSNATIINSDWIKCGRGVYRRTDGVKIVFVNQVFVNQEAIRGISVTCSAPFCFIPQQILGEVLKDFGYSIVTTATPERDLERVRTP